MSLLSQTDDNFQKTKSQWIEKILRRVAVLQLIFHVKTKGGDVGGL